MRDDKVRAAAERLLSEAAAHIEAVVSGGHDPLTDDILTVASYALEAGQEVERYRAALEAIRANYGKVCAEFELCNHAACASSVGAWMEADAALSTPGGPESGG